MQTAILPADLGLKNFPSWRDSQFETITKIACGLDKHAFILEAPWGIGKSLIGVSVPKLLGRRAIILTHTKQLQEQYQADFPEAAILKGRVNYPCLLHHDNFPEITADDCIHTEKNPCELIGPCPYRIAKRRAKAADLVLMNYAYYLNEVNYIGMFDKADILVCDEADTIEHPVMSFIELTITQNQLAKLNLSPPRYKTKFEAWLEWARLVLPEVLAELVSIEDAIENTGDWQTVDYKLIRKRNRLQKFLAKLQFFVKNVDSNWVWYDKSYEWTFKPVWIKEFCNDVLWSHAKDSVSMSATILDPRRMSWNLGIDSFNYLALDCPFPVANRPIYYHPVGDMSHDCIEQTLPVMAKELERLLQMYSDVKVLVHTVSYDICKYMLDNVASHRFVTHNEKNRSQVLDYFKLSPDPFVLMSPSMDRGVNLPGDEARCVIVLKTPYPNLADPQIRKRLYSGRQGQAWYEWATRCTLIQMTGRHIRSMTDRGDCWILDSHAEQLGFNRFPEWWRRALIMK